MREVRANELINEHAQHINVMIVDDDAIVREGLASLLEQNATINVKAHASSGEEAIKIAENNDFDVILMDIKMHGLNGIEATKRLCLMNADTKILALSAYNNESHPSEIIQHGAKGYLTKGVSYQEMCEAIHSVHAGGTYVCSAVSDKIRKNLNLGRDLILNQLTEKEINVCKEIIYGVPLENIAHNIGISINEITTLRDNIYSKLDINNDIAMMHLAIRNGLIDQAQ
ncbi:response regulator transcription factor [Gammaproteobacteria bacterium]|nr:response regulator transcription factor [Gammaproteobacteria bacterium]